MENMFLRIVGVRCANRSSTFEFGAFLMNLEGKMQIEITFIYRT